MFTSRYLPCSDCGASVDRTDPAPHECRTERLVDFQMFRLRGRVAGFDRSWAGYLSSAEGRFETWLAARDVRRSAT